MIDLKRVSKYCCEDITLIENYEKAISDNIQTWNCHHRKETDENLSLEDLINDNLYWARPANELIFLTKAEHNKIHNIDRIYVCSEETKRKISEKNKGRKQSEEERNKRSIILKEYYKNNKRSEETRNKLSKSLKGKNKKGHPHTEETKIKISESHIGRPSYIKGKHKVWDNKELNIYHFE